MSLLRPSGDLLTIEAAAGPEVVFPASPASTSISGGDTLVEGTVSGATAGNTVVVDLLYAGSLLASAEISDGAFHFELGLQIAADQGLRALASEWSEGTLVRVGTASLQVASNHVWSGAIALDEPLDQVQEVTVSGAAPGLAPYLLEYWMVFDEGALQPFGIGAGVVSAELAGDHAAVPVPTGAGSLRDGRLRFLIRSMGSYAHPDAEGWPRLLDPGQMAVVERDVGETTPIHLPLLALPVFQLPVGTRDAPAAHLGVNLDVALEVQESPYNDLTLTIRSQRHSADYSWRILMGNRSSAFRTFAFPAELRVRPLPTMSSLVLTANLRREEGPLRLLARADGVVLLDDKGACPDLLPAWTAGTFAVIVPLDGAFAGQCLVDDHRVVVSECGQVTYSVGGGDFFGGGFGMATAEPGSQEVWIDVFEDFDFIFPQQQRLLATPQQEPIHGLSAVALQSPTADERYLMVKIPAVAPVALPAEALGAYVGEQVRIDILADEAGAAGWVLAEGTWTPADGSETAVGSYRVEISEGGGYNESERFELAVLSRQGVFTSWDRGGEVAFTNTRGVCSDDRARAKVTELDVDSFRVESTARRRDSEDWDGDGATDDSVFLRQWLDISKLPEG